MIRSRRLALLCAGAATAVTAVAAVALAVPDASAASNTIANPGFETGSLASWSCSSVDSVVPTTRSAARPSRSRPTRATR